MEEMVEIAEDLFVAKVTETPDDVVFTYIVTIVLGRKNIGLIDSGFDITPSHYIFPLLSKMERKPEDINLVVNTHSDPDHISGNEEIKAKSKATIVAHELDAEAIGNVDRKLKDGELIELGDRTFEVLHTPGHTSGSICLYDEDSQTLISGDSVQGHGYLGQTLVRTSNEEYISSMKRLLNHPITTLIVNHPYEPFHEVVLTEKEPKIMILESIEAAKQITAEQILKNRSIH